MSLRKEHTDVLKLFEDKVYVKICAPMVRYSKLQFRTLVREYGADLCFTPMILADSFCQSAKSRNNEFTTNLDDTPLITQFAANTVHDFVGAANFIHPYCDGIDLNCGCPQRWAKQQGIGCTMMENPELISSIVKGCRNLIPKPFTVSVKMRILKDLKKTVDICRQLESAGVSFLSIHARTAAQSTGDINVEALKLIVENVSCPVVGNGAIRNLEDCERLQNQTNCKGIMVANSILSNPTLFCGTEKTSLECVQKWIDICYNSTIDFETCLKPSGTICVKPKNLTFQCFHHHLVFMLEKFLAKAKRRVFNNLKTFAGVFDFLSEELNMEPRLFDRRKFERNSALELNYDHADGFYDELRGKYGAALKVSDNSYASDDASGKYFNKMIGGDEYDLNDLFT